MRKVILDTDIVSEYWKAHDLSVVSAGVAYLKFHPAFTITSVTVYEITYGLAAKNAESQLQKAVRWMNRQEEIEPAREDFRFAASVKASARKMGLVVELPDCLIAAAAVRLGLPLITGNTADYESIRKTGVPLELQNWRAT